MSQIYSATKRTFRRWVEATAPGYAFFLRRDHDVRGSLRRPLAPWHNSVLKSRQERDAAVEQVRNLKLPLLFDAPKNWDSLAALDCVLATTSKRARILDAGAEMYSRILPWLCMYGYRRLEGINIAFKEQVKLGSIKYKYGDITGTDYDSETFDAITCLSVVEHGVDLKAYFGEMSRILKRGGVLITSTDYWQTATDSKGQHMYGVPVNVFTQDDILKALELAERSGLVLTAPIDLTCNEKVVHWKEVGLDYTFLIFTLRKVS
jgi:SAM-dependent methyltransferase